MKHLSKKLFSFLLTLFGVSSCVLPCMYGSPYADFDISGKVKDENGKGIPQIKVAIGEVFTNSQNVIYDYNYRPIDTLTTDSEGHYSLICNSFPAENIRITALDIDGDANGGKFKKDSIDITEIEYTGDTGSWYRGELLLRDVDFTLKKEE